MADTPNLVSWLTVVYLQLRLVHRTIDYTYLSMNQPNVAEAVETLCRRLCDSNEVLSLRRINPNPNLIFTVGVDPNSPVDDLFLRSFVKHNARLDVSLKRARGNR